MNLILCQIRLFIFKLKISLRQTQPSSSTVYVRANLSFKSKRYLFRIMRKPRMNKKTAYLSAGVDSFYLLVIFLKSKNLNKFEVKHRTNFDSFLSVVIFSSYNSSWLLLPAFLLFRGSSLCKNCFSLTKINPNESSDGY